MCTKPRRFSAPDSSMVAARSALSSMLALMLVTLWPAVASADPPAQAAREGLAAVLERIADRWGFVLVGASLVFVTYLVNRYAPQKRVRIRRVVILFGLYLLTFGLSVGLVAAGFGRVGDVVRVVSTILQAFTIINLIALAIFELALPAMRVDLLSITTDLLTGVAYIVTLIWILRASGMNPSGLVAGSAVASGILAISLQTTLGNILGGIALQADGSIHVGDWIQLENGKQGKVKEIRWRHTVVETRDWDTIIVPNASLLGSNITILGKREGQPLQHRMWVYFNVDFRYQPTRVMEVVEAALRAAPIEGVATDPPPNCICFDFSKDYRESFAYYAVRYWLTDLAKDDPTSSLVRTRVYAALRRADIPLARPAKTTFVHLESEETQAKKLERSRDRSEGAIREMDIFQALTDAEIATLALRVQYSPFVAGETITRQGSVAHWLYVLTSGETEVRANVEGVSRTVAVIKAPGYFGEMGLMTGEPRAADVVAKTHVECFRLDKESFEKVLQNRPEIAQAISQTIAARKVELIATREGLDAAAKAARAAAEGKKILDSMKSFFGLSE
jgi:small-conductance mechanosensitive channel/CRP-like cAMP-binding protein